jgi:hypothetical protein
MKWIKKARRKNSIWSCFVCAPTTTRKKRRKLIENEQFNHVIIVTLKKYKNNNFQTQNHHYFRGRAEINRRTFTIARFFHSFHFAGKETGLGEEKEKHCAKIIMKNRGEEHVQEPSSEIVNTFRIAFRRTLEIL